MDINDDLSVDSLDANMDTIQTGEGGIKINYCKPTPIDLYVLDKQFAEQRYQSSLEIMRVFPNFRPNLDETLLLQDESASSSENKTEMIEVIPTSHSSYSPYVIQDIQLYNPIYSRFFEMTPKNSDRIALNHPYHIKDITHIVDLAKKTVIEKDVFVKFSPLLDPFRYMIGKYDVNDARIRSMPRIDSTEDTVHPKILSHNNASYVDCFFSYLSSALLHKHGFVHGVDFYGSFLGVQNKFKVCVTDDMDYLRGSDFFNKNTGSLFYIEDNLGQTGGSNDDVNQIGGSRQNKRRLMIDQCDNAHNLTSFSVTELDDNFGVLSVPIDSENIMNIMDPETIYTKSPRSVSSNTSNGSSKSSSNSDLNYSSSDEEDGVSDGENDNNNKNDNKNDDDNENDDDDDDDWETDDETDDEADGTDKTSETDDTAETDETEEEVYGYINNFPVQMICMEKCDGTLDELFVKHEMDEEQGSSALFQIIMILLAYQKAFQFTHNDLHTNNVMYTKTNRQFLTYKFAGKIYEVPTYGKIYKVIDFGRSIYKFQNRAFCSDSFAPGGDAATQYNFEPFMNNNKPRLEPNFAFDLCRLGSSIFDFIMDVDEDPAQMDGLQRTIHRWCLDDNGKNVLYKKNGEERYPSFKLYKMIARTVHAHSPEAQLEDEYFKQFLRKNNEPCASPIFDLDVLPCYV